MNDVCYRINSIIKHTIDTILPWIIKRDGVIQFIDPLDNEEISAHYGAVFTAASLLIYGRMENNESLSSIGDTLLLSILDRWRESSLLPGFHNDFNNYALCVLDSIDNRYHDRIVETVLSTPDSSHYTINWLPMRWFVNQCRYQWTNDKRFKKKCESLNGMIKEATYSDGFIDDLLPKGTSFNLQYDVSTVATLQFLRIQGEQIDLSNEFGALLNVVCPDGDINYFGRGTNQIFAWGPWLYLLSSSCNREINRALTYLEHNVDAMLDNKNIFLNSFKGEEKNMWWDYHYCSVYLPHFLFWSVLAKYHNNVSAINPALVSDSSSGIHVYRNTERFVVVFDGRKEYLCERGPAIVAIWDKNYGVICKGTFGPWGGRFGNRYSQPISSLLNYTGLLSIKKNNSNSFLFKAYQKLFGPYRNNAQVKIKPLFSSVSVNIESGITISWTPVSQDSVLNLAFSQAIENDSIRINDQSVFCSPFTIKNQYGLINVFQCFIDSGSKIEMVILECKKDK